jgi:hypothetical protein
MRKKKLGLAGLLECATGILPVSSTPDGLEGWIFHPVQGPGPGFPWLASPGESERLVEFGHAFPDHGGDGCAFAFEAGAETDRGGEVAIRGKAEILWCDFQGVELLRRLDGIVDGFPRGCRATGRRRRD